MRKKTVTIGILSTLRNHPELPFGGQTEPFKEIISTAEKKGCLAFVFTLRDVDWTQKKVLGYRPNKGFQEWERVPFSLPTVIYNRLPNRSIEQKEDYWEALALLSSLYGRRFFNPFFLNKWSVYKILASHRSSETLVPATKKLSTGNFLDMINKYNSVYLKPMESSLGMGIYKWTLNKKNQNFTCTGVDKSKTLLRTSDFFSYWRDFPFYQKPYLVQQTIKLARYHNRPLDFRVLYQKNGAGLWKKTGFAARVAGLNSITTHVMYGGSRVSAREVLRNTFDPEISQQVNAAITNIAGIVPPLLEKSYGRQFAELTMDIGVDVKGKPWIFEVNSKPFKFDEPLIRAKSLVRLLDYILYLSRQRG